MEEKGRRLALQAVFTRVRVHEHGGGGGEGGEGERESSVSCIREGGTRGRKTGNTDPIFSAFLHYADHTLRGSVQGEEFSTRLAIYGSLDVQT